MDIDEYWRYSERLKKEKSMLNLSGKTRKLLITIGCIGYTQ